MANKAFQATKWIVKSSNEDEPANWNESEVIFFSDRFMDYVKSTNDPRDEPEEYFLWYCPQMDEEDEEWRVYLELEMVLGDAYDEEMVEKIKGQDWDEEEFIRQVFHKESQDGRLNSFLNDKSSLSI